jgi:RHS repeat-associated protein
MLITESSSSGTVKAEYIYLNGQPLAKIEGNDVYYYHNDHLGTSMMMTDSSAATVWEGEYMPFGESYSVTGTVTNNLRFPGQYFDSETGMHQNWTRDYNPVVGRYVETDSAGIDKGKNHLYVYAKNNSLRFTDPLGLAAGVSVCVRPLAALPNALPWWASPVNHAYIQIGNWSAGFQGDSTVHVPEDNPNHAGKKCWPAQKRNGGTFPDGTDCKCASDDQIQNCIKSYSQQGSQAGGYPSYGVVSNNCGDWVINALSRCCLKGKIPYHWY